MTPPSKDATPDLIVVGGGISGLSAAISAAEHGASVTVLDRAHGGGASAISGGVVYAGGGTKQQRESGHGDDTPEDMLQYLRHEVGDAVDATTLRRFCADSAANLEWLEKHGAEFNGTLCPFKTSLPTSGYHLYFSGNEMAHPFVEFARPVPRGHKTFGKGSETGLGHTGGHLWKALFDSALRLGIQFKPACRVKEVLVDDGGRVKGVRCASLAAAPGWARRTYKWLCQTAPKYNTTFQQLYGLLNWIAERVFWWGAREEIFESRAVVLAAGGFIANSEMIHEYAPWAHNTAPLGTAGDDGSGIRLGQAVGGSVSHMHRISAWRMLYPPTSLLEGIIVSPDGARIAAEDMYGGSFANAMVERSGGRGFLILDSAQRERVKSEIGSQTRSTWRLFVRAMIFWMYQSTPSLGGLARKLGVNARALAETVDAYNAAIREGKPDPVRKLHHRSAIERGPFYGIEVSLRNSGLLMVPALTLGGLRVDSTSGLVLDQSGGTIQGLYAVGRNAVGICSNTYISGLSIADCVFSGRRAGEHVARACKMASGSSP